MVIRLRRLPMPLRVLCVLLAVLLLAGTVFAPVARAEALTATIALFGGAALVSGVLAAAGLKASDSAAWNSWCAQIAASDSVRSAAQALTKIALPAAKLVALVYAGKTYVSKALQQAIINEAITAGAYDTATGDITLNLGTLNPAQYADYKVDAHFTVSSAYIVRNTGDPDYYFSVSNAIDPVYFSFFTDSVVGTSNYNSVRVAVFSVSSFSLLVKVDGYTYTTAAKRHPGFGLYYISESCGIIGPKAIWINTVGSMSPSLSACYDASGRYYSASSYQPLGYWLAAALKSNGLVEPSAGIEGVTSQDGAISDPIGKDVIGSLDDLKTKVTDWSDYLDTGIDIAIDGAAEGAAADAIPSLPVTIPTAGQQGAQTYPDARTGTTDSTVIDSGTDTATVSENQSVVSKLLSDVIDYIRPDTGFFSKFPLCIPYDVYLFFSALSGKDMSDSSIFSATPDSLGVANTSELDTLAADQWEPVLDIDQDWSISGFDIPFHIHLDFTPFLPVFDLIRVSIGAFFVFDLIIYEWNRTRGE